VFLPEGTGPDLTIAIGLMNAFKPAGQRISGSAAGRTGLAVLRPGGRTSPAIAGPTASQGFKHGDLILDMAASDAATRASAVTNDARH